MKISDLNCHKELLQLKNILIGKYNGLLNDYRDLQKYFIGSSSLSEANDKYCYQLMDELGYDSESSFFVNHNPSLFKEIENNKKGRSDLETKITDIKNRLKELNKNK